MAKKKKTRRLRQILGNGKEQIFTVQNGQVINKRIVRKKIKTKMNVFDPLQKKGKLIDF